jgi:8-hydroxy-5-deazaflavin:NADPH oxidoreductase
MKVGILGSGAVAKSLAAGCLKYGHHVMLGTRTASKLTDWAVQHPAAKIGPVADAAAFGEVIVLAVKGTAAADVLRSAGAAALKGKVVIDTTNPIAPEPPVNGILKYFTTLDDSLMERLQREFPAARFVKAFSSVGNAAMVDPNFAGGKPTMFICGNDAPAKQVVRGILDDFGWETEDMGGVEAARAIEPLCMLWCIPGFVKQDWMHAFKMLR